MLSGNGDLAATDEKEASPEESSEVSGGSDSETVKGISPEAASKKALEPSLSQAGMPENGKESEAPQRHQLLFLLRRLLQKAPPM